MPHNTADVDGGSVAPRPMREMVLELRRRQRRLGTASEAPDDFEAILRLAHAINNALCAIYLADALGMTGTPDRAERFRRAIQESVA
jgi:hypothetical protein